MRAAGTQFAFIKATEGGDHVDERFRANWDGRRARPACRAGAYHFVFWCRSAQDQMAWFKKNVPNDPTALPPVLDVEWNGHSQLCPKKLPKAQALAMIRYMLDEMERYTGKRPIIYTDITFHKDVLEDELPDYPHWVRSTAAEPEQRYAKRKWMLWQFTSTGRVPGVRGDVDRNAFYGTTAEWASFLSTDCDPRDHRNLADRASARASEPAAFPDRTVDARARPCPGTGARQAPAPSRSPSRFRNGRPWRRARRRARSRSGTAGCARRGRSTPRE